MSQNGYKKQVELLLKALPEVLKMRCLALKGGIAINFFIRNMPRLSVDIDLVYLPKEESREQFLQHQTHALEVLAKNIEQNISNCRIHKSYINNTKYLSKFVVSKNSAKIKIETNTVLRESIFDCELKDLCQKAQDDFLLFTQANVLSFAELYAGKICATLDRQHPRDLFDVKLLLENEGITSEMRRAFVVYLASSPRPMHELLNTNSINIGNIFESEFDGMTNFAVNREELLDAGKKLKYLLLRTLSDEERRFLISFKQGTPEWDLLRIPGIETFPSLQWKLINIRKMGKQKWRQSIENLKKSLDL